MENKIQKLIKKKQGIIAQNPPPLTEIFKGTFIKWYQVCARDKCKCHK